MRKQACNALKEKIDRGSKMSDLGLSSEEIIKMTEDCNLSGYKINLNKNLYREMFFDNPEINPETGRKITINGSVYKLLVKKYGNPVEEKELSKPKVRKVASPKKSATKKLGTKKSETKVAEKPKTRKSGVPKGVKQIELVKPKSRKKQELDDSVFDEPKTDLEEKKEFINFKGFKSLFRKNQENKIPESREPLYSTKTFKQICKEFKEDPSVNPETGRKINMNGKKYNYLKEKCIDESEEKNIPKSNMQKLMEDYRTSNRPLKEEISNPLIINSTKTLYTREGIKKVPRICNNFAQE